MRIRVIKGFGGYKPGQCFDWADGMCRVLVARGLIAPVEDDAVEHATAEQRSERAVLQHSVKRKAK